MHANAQELKETQHKGSVNSESHIHFLHLLASCQKERLLKSGNIGC